MGRKKTYGVELSCVGLGGCDGAFFTDAQPNYVVGLFCHRRVYEVGYSGRSSPLAPGLRENADDVRALTTLTDTQYKSVRGEERRFLI